MAKLKILCVDDDGMDGARFMLNARQMGLKAGFVLLTGLRRDIL